MPNAFILEMCYYAADVAVVAWAHAAPEQPE